MLAVGMLGLVKVYSASPQAHLRGLRCKNAWCRQLLQLQLLPLLLRRRGQQLLLRQQRDHLQLLLLRRVLRQACARVQGADDEEGWGSDLNHNDNVAGCS